MLKNASDKNTQTNNNGVTADTNNKPNDPNAEPMRFVAPTHGGVDILKLLTELEDIVENSPKRMGLMFGFDEDKFHMTIMKIRANLPEEMKRASKLARDSERIVEETHQSAERVVNDARQMARTEIERGKAEAQKMRDEAQAEVTRQMQSVQSQSAQAQQMAKQVREKALAEAQVQVEALVADSEIVRLAQAQAQDIRTRAEDEAHATQIGADDYARDVLAKLENVLGNTMSQVQRGREMLEQSR